MKPTSRTNEMLAIQATFLSMLAGNALCSQGIRESPATPLAPDIGLKVEVSANGASVSKTPTGKEIPHSATRIVFSVTEKPGGKPNSCRLRFKLVGIDPNWVPRESDMTLFVYFRDAKDQPVETDHYLFAGESKGWTGAKIEPSAFTHRTESLTVPPNAISMRLTISSAGPPDAIGVLLVKDLVVWEANTEGFREKVLLDTSASEVARPAGSPPPGWISAGINPQMAKMVTVDETKPEAFGIIDTDPRGHAEWSIVRENAIKVTPGKHVLLEWNELFSIGQSETFSTAYGSLPPGGYRFVVGRLDPFGNPMPGEASLDVIVPLPFWKSLWFQALCMAIFVASTILIVRAIFRAKTRRQLERAEQAHLLEAERLRIARDIHDDLGARLTHISLLSGLAENEAESDRDRHIFEKISEMSRELVSALYQTVWTVNPENDELESLVSFLGQLAHRLCEDAGIRCRVTAPELPGKITVTSDFRHHVIMTVKEAVHNAVKHAQASEIRIDIEFSSRGLGIVIDDDGAGFDPRSANAGCGLSNMRNRMKAIGGDLQLESQAGKGTRIRIDVPISGARGARIARHQKAESSQEYAER
jgi:signal transduction histidine kinase